MKIEITQEILKDTFFNLIRTTSWMPFLCMALPVAFLMVGMEMAIVQLISFFDVSTGLITHSIAYKYQYLSSLTFFVLTFFGLVVPFCKVSVNPEERPSVTPSVRIAALIAPIVHAAWFTMCSGISNDILVVMISYFASVSSVSIYAIMGSKLDRHEEVNSVPSNTTWLNRSE